MALPPLSSHREGTGVVDSMGSKSKIATKTTRIKEIGGTLPQ